MVFSSAFQPDAFQINAFQINAEGGGGSSGGAGAGGGGKPWHHNVEVLYVHPESSKVKKEYVKALKIDKNNRLSKVVDTFARPENEQEKERRDTATYMFDVSPPAHRIDFETLVRNELAMERLNAAIKKIKQEFEEEVFILIMMMGL